MRCGGLESCAALGLARICEAPGLSPAKTSRLRAHRVANEGEAASMGRALHETSSGAGAPADDVDRGEEAGSQTACDGRGIQRMAGPRQTAAAEEACDSPGGGA